MTDKNCFHDINPTTGLPMTDDCTFDVGGNLFGTDDFSSHDDLFSADDLFSDPWSSFDDF